MFTSQAPGTLHQLTRAGMPYDQAQALVSVIGQCMSSLKTNGFTEFNGPVRFAQQPQNSDGTSLIQLAQLQEDLVYGNGHVKAITQTWSPTGASSGGKQIDVYPGPLLRDGDQITAGSLIGLVDFDGFKCPLGSNNADGLSSIGASPEGGGAAVTGSYKVVELDGELSVDGSASATVQMRSGSAWIDKVPAETITVYDAFLTGDEVLPSGTRVGVHLTDQGIYVVGDAQAN